MQQKREEPREQCSCNSEARHFRSETHRKQNTSEAQDEMSSGECINIYVSKNKYNKNCKILHLRSIEIQKIFTNLMRVICLK